MKKISILLVMAFTVISCFTIKSTVVNIAPVSDQVQAEGEKNALFVRANNWMVEQFVSAKDVIQFSDKESGVVTGKYLMNPATVISTYANSSVINQETYAIIKIQVKDGAGKITIAPAEFSQLITQNKTQRELYYSEDKARAKIADLIASFKNYMKNDTSDSF